MDGDGPRAIAELADRVGAAAAKAPNIAMPGRPAAGAITMQNIAAALAHALPDDAIVVAEAVSWGGGLLYTSPSPRDRTRSRMPASA